MKNLPSVTGKNPTWYLYSYDLSISLYMPYTTSSLHRTLVCDRNAIAEQIKEMCVTNQSITTQPFSPWSSPVLLVNKNLEISVSFRAILRSILCHIVSIQSQNNVYPLSWIEVSLGRLGSVQYIRALSFEACKNKIVRLQWILKIHHTRRSLNFYVCHLGGPELPRARLTC